MKRYDVVILGSHLSTGLLAAILGRHGVRVAVVPTAADRELPSGETTVPYTAELFYLLGSRFGIPEIAAMGMFRDLPAEIRATSGVKRNLGFLYHRAGKDHDPAEALQFRVPGEHVEWHLHRPDVDDYAVRLAVRHGATLFDAQAAPHGVDPALHGVTVALTDGRLVEAEYLVDGSGAGGLLPPALPVPRPAGATHRARLLHAHFKGVRPFEAVVPPADHGRPDPWSEGTLQHAFPGGWIQVVPFGNHPEGGADLCSVTVSLDPDHFPPGRLAPDEEFFRIAGRFPALAAQFADAAPVGPWRQHESWPAAVDRCAGPRWFLFDRSAGRQDLLLSRDVTLSLELVHATAAGLLEMAGERDWAGDVMDRAAEYQVRLFAFHDRLIAAGRAAAESFPTWNAYLRVWLLWTILSAMSLKRARLDGEGRTGGERWSPVEGFEGAEFWYQVPAGLPELLSESLDDLLAIPAGLDPGTAAERIYQRLRTAPFIPPLFKFADPNARYYRFTIGRRLRMLWWVKTTAPDDFRRLLTIDNVTAIPESHAVRESA
jgi:FADH2 O2-dependent halogenase